MYVGQSEQRARRSPPQKGIHLKQLRPEKDRDKEFDVALSHSERQLDINHLLDVTRNLLQNPFRLIYCKI